MRGGEGGEEGEEERGRREGGGRVGKKKRVQNVCGLDIFTVF